MTRPKQTWFLRLRYWLWPCLHERVAGFTDDTYCVECGVSVKSRR